MIFTPKDAHKWAFLATPAGSLTRIAEATTCAFDLQMDTVAASSTADRPEFRIAYRDFEPVDKWCYIDEGSALYSVNYDSEPFERKSGHIVVLRSSGTIEYPGFITPQRAVTWMLLGQYGVARPFCLLSDSALMEILQNNVDRINAVGKITAKIIRGASIENDIFLSLED